MPFLFVVASGPSIIQDENSQSGDNRGGRKREKDPFFSRGRSNLGRAKQSRPRNRGRGVGGVRKGRDDATGREIFGGGRGSSMVGGRCLGGRCWVDTGWFRRREYESATTTLAFCSRLCSFFLFPWEINVSTYISRVQRIERVI